MEPALIMKTASCLLAIAVLGGLTMAGIRFNGKPQPPTWLAILHGFLAAAAVHPEPDIPGADMVCALRTAASRFSTCGASGRS